MMLTGRMRQRVTIQQEHPTRDSVGAEVAGWADVATVWAEITAAPAGSDQQFRSDADQWQAQLLYRVKLRYRAGLSIKNRLLWEGRILTMLSLVDPDGKTREWRLIVMEVVQ